MSPGVREAPMGTCFAGHGLCINGMLFLSPREALPFLESEAILVDIRGWVPGTHLLRVAAVVGEGAVGRDVWTAC